MGVDMKTFFFSISMVLLLGFQSDVRGQSWLYSIESDQKFTTTPFAFRYYDNSFISILRGDIEWSNDWLTIDWTPEYQTFSNNSDYNFLSHDLTISIINGNWESEIGISQQQSSTTITGFTWINPNAGIYYRNESETGWWESGLSLSGLFFEDPIELNQLNLSGYYEWNQSFETRTSLTLGSKIGAKYFLNSSDQNVQLSDSISTSTLASTNLEGYGKMKGSATQSGMGKGASSSRLQNQIAGLSDSWFKISQNINSWSAVNFSGNLHYVLTPKTKANFSVSSPTVLASELIDDNSGYNSESVNIGMNFLFQYDISLKISGFYEWRQYSAQSVYTDEITLTDSKRVDNKPGVSISAEKYISFWSTDQGILLNLTSYYQNNQSNSYWYNYSTSGIKVNLRYDF